MQSEHGECPECGAEGAAQEGECPYQSEINETTLMCDCCEQCRHECAMDI